MDIGNIGEHGLIHDVRAHLLKPNIFNKARNVRVRHGAILRTPGDTEVYDTLPEQALWLLPHKDETGDRWFVCGPTSIQEVDQGGVTQVGTGYSPVQWSGGVLNGIPVFNDGSLSNAPLYWDGAAIQTLPNWPATYGADILRVWGNFLLAFGIKAGIDYNEYLFKWSHPADPGALPSTWDPADKTKLAGSRTLADTKGALVDFLELGSDLAVIYKEDKCYGLRFIGGQQIWATPSLFDFGLLAPRCVKRFKRRHFCVSQDDILVHDGNSWESIGQATHRRWLFNSMEPTQYKQTFVTKNENDKEMWICFVSREQVSTYPNTALIWNWRENTWAIRDLPESPHIGYGFVDTSTTSEIIDDEDRIVDEIDTTIDATSFNPTLNNLLMCVKDGKLRHIDEGLSFNGAEFLSTIERTGIAHMPGRSEWVSAPGRRKLVRRLTPVMNGTGTVRFYLGQQELPTGGTAWKGPFNFRIGIDKKIDGPVNGTYWGWRMESDDGNSWELLDLDADVVDAGQSNV